MDKEKNPTPDSDENALEQPDQSSALENPSSVQDEIHIQPEDVVPIGTESTSKHILRSIRGALNIYLLIFVLLIVIAVVVFIVSYINSQNNSKTPSTPTQNLSQKDLSAIASGDAQIGDARYVLNVQSDAVFAGSALVRKDLNVAGSLQLGQALNVANVTITSTGAINTAQVNTLNVANAASIQGKLSSQSDVTFSKGLNVGGSLIAGQITTGSLTLSGNGNLNLNNHIRATGPTPGRSQGGAVGGGGTTSLSGSDIAGTLTVNTGNSPSPGCFATISFVQKYTTTPRVIVSPTGQAAAQLEYYVSKSSGGFSICTANAAPSASSFTFDYFVIE